MMNVGEETAGVFVTFEGPEGSGKTTQIQLLATALRERGHSVLTTREPGGTALGNAIRTLLLQETDTHLCARAEALLFNAARAQLVDEVIQPARARGQIVLCDRYMDSTLAYQGYGRNLCLSDLRALTNFATGHLMPDLTIFLDIEPRDGLQRKQADKDSEWNRMDVETLAFHRTVRNGFLQLAVEEPERWRIIDATQPIAVVQQMIWENVVALFADSFPAASPPK
jgi:dTMP kinase